MTKVRGHSHSSPRLPTGGELVEGEREGRRGHSRGWPPEVNMAAPPWRTEMEWNGLGEHEKSELVKY